MWSFGVVRERSMLVQMSLTKVLERAQMRGLRAQRSGLEQLSTSFRASAAALALSLGLVSCEAGEPGGAPIRLVEHTGAATIESAVDLSAAARDAQAAARTLHTGALDSLPPERRFQHKAEWVGPVLFDDEGDDETPLGSVSVAAGLVDVEPKRRLSIRARVPHSERIDRFFALELSFAPTTAELADPNWAEKLFRQIGSFQRQLTPRVAAAKELVLETSFMPQASTQSVLLCRAGELGDSGTATFDVLQFTERDGWLYSSALAHRAPNVRSVTALRDTREALVVALPGALRFDLTLPGGRPRFTTGVTPMFGTAGTEIAIQLTVRGEHGLVEHDWSIPADTASWLQVDVALDELAGEAVELTLSADAPGGARDALLAFGAPVIESNDPRELFDIVMISLDTLRADRSSAYGYDVETTPALARLAAESVVFDNAITTAPWTLPAHISLFSGQYPDRHRVFGQHSRLAPETPWICEEFQRAGYRTLAFTGSGYVNPEFGFARGFDRYAFTDPSYPPTAWLSRRRELGLSPGSPNVRPPRTRTELLKLLAEPRRAARFLFVHTYAAHNYAAGPDDLLALGAAQRDIDELLEGVDPNALNRQLEQDPNAPDAERLRARANFLYDASLRVADRLVADVVAALESSGRLEHTILVVLSDHGEELFERGHIGHGGSVFEEMVHVPLFVRIPGVAPRRVPDVVSLVDIAPTLRELCSLAAPAAADFEDGTSLVPLLAGEQLDPRNVVARGTRRDLVFRCLRGPDFKFVLEARPGDPGQSRWFRLDQDPSELHDQAPERPDDAKRLASTLRERIDQLEAMSPASIDAELSGDVLEKLKELGYLE